MSFDHHDKSLNEYSAKGTGYLIVVVLLWAVVILFIFTMLSGRVENKAPTRFDDRYSEYQSNFKPEVYTNYSARLDEVVLTRGASGHYMHKGLINDEEVVFIIDTGASDISIPGHIAERLDLDVGEKIYFQTANGVATGFKTVLDTVSMGDISLDNVRASINPNVKVNYILLGMSFLSEVNFSQEDGKLIIQQ